MKKATLTMLMLLMTAATAPAADKPATPSSKAPGAMPGTAAAALVQSPLKPVISTAGAEPKFGVMNTGNTPSAAGAVLNITCVPAMQGGPVCKLNQSNDPMVQSGVATVNVPVLAKGETRWYGLTGCAAPCTAVPSSAPAKDWQKAGYTFTLVVAGNHTNGTHTWNKP
jgi:hypothetical protein